MDERITAARALGKFNRPEATEALLKVLQTEKDVALRDRAAEALQQITGKQLPADAKAWQQALHPAVGPNGQPAPAPPKKEKFLGLF
jgi:HEAT repeat protein